jgi:Ca2+-binding RTX toxin-like protein
MAKHVISKHLDGPYTIKRFYDDWRFTHQSEINAIGTAMIVNGGDDKIDISGKIVSANDAAIRVGGDDNSLHVHKVGMLAGGGSGITLLGSGTDIVNDGIISATNAGIVNNQNYGLDNTGKISGNAALLTYSDAQIVNQQQGSLSGVAFGLQSREDSNAHIKLANHGLLQGQQAAYYGSNGVDRVVNDGDVVGDVNMRDGKDMFDNRGGSINGAIYGGGGNDTLITDNANVILNESVGGGRDTVKSTVSFTLTTNVERSVLLGSGDINATGNSLDNRIIGNDGDNILTGGEGNDTLTGGGGNDVFAFHNRAYQDIVTDFTDGHDKLNVTGYDAIFDFDDIKSHMVQAGDAVMITFSGLSGDHVVLQHVNINQIDSSDFVFG